MKNTNSIYISKLLGSHAAWIEQGLTIQDVKKTHSELRDTDPFTFFNYNHISRELNINPILDYSPEKIDYLFIDDIEFDGNLNHFKELVNLEDIYISGINVDSKITDLSPLIDLKNIRSLNVKYNSISDLAPLIEIPALESITLSDNPIEDLSALESLRNLKYLNYTDLNDELVSRILKKNKECLVEYCNREYGCYLSFNLKGEPVKVASHLVEGSSRLIVEVTFLGNDNVPLEAQAILQDERVLGAVRERHSKEVSSYETHGNTFLIWHELS